MSQLHRGCRDTVLLFALALVGLWTALPAVLLAYDPLSFIPADTPVVVGFQRLEQSGRRLDEFLRRFDPDFAGLDLDEVQRGFGLPDGVLDTSAPAYLLLTRSVVAESSFVLVFKPRSSAGFLRKLSTGDRGLHRLATSDGSCYLVLRDDVAFAGLSPRAMMFVRRVASENSLASSLSAQERAILEDSDAFVRFSLAAWRDRIRPFVFLTSNLVKLGIHSRDAGQAASETLDVIDWFAAGAASAIDQMQTFSAAFRFDGRTFRLTHHHTFTDQGPVARYLAQVRRSGFDGLTLMPDQPFFLVGAFDWGIPGESSLTRKFSDHVFDLPAMRGRLTDDQRRRLQETTSNCYGRMRGSFLMVTSPPDRLQPMQILGGYAMRDARKGLEQLRFIQENSGEVLTAMTGSRMFGSFQIRTEAGRTVHEMNLDYEGMDPAIRRQTTIFYGEGVRVQEAVLDEDHVGYVTAQPPLGVAAMSDARETGRHVGTQPPIRRMLAELPEERHMLVVLDLGRCLSAVPIWVQAGLTTAGLPSQPSPVVSGPYSAAPGPFLAWSGTAGERSFTGCLLMEADDVLRAADSLQQMAEGVNDLMTGGGAPPPGPPVVSPRGRPNRSAP